METVSGQALVRSRVFPLVLVMCDVLSSNKNISSNETIENY